MSISYLFLPSKLTHKKYTVFYCRKKSFFCIKNITGCTFKIQTILASWKKICIEYQEDTINYLQSNSNEWKIIIEHASAFCWNLPIFLTQKNLSKIYQNAIGLWKEKYRSREKRVENFCMKSEILNLNFAGADDEGESFVSSWCSMQIFFNSLNWAKN